MESKILKWHKVCADWYVTGICWVLNLDVHITPVFGVAFFDDGALDDITNVSSFIMNLSGTCRLKQLLFKSFLQQKHAWTWAVEDLKLFWGCRSCGMEKKVHASWKGFRSLQNQSRVQASKTTPPIMSTGTNMYIQI